MECLLIAVRFLDERVDCDDALVMPAACKHLFVFAAALLSCVSGAAALSTQRFFQGEDDAVRLGDGAAASAEIQLPQVLPFYGAAYPSAYVS